MGVAIALVLVLGGTYLGLREFVWTGQPDSGLSAQWTDQRPAAGCDSSPWISGGLVVQCSGSGIAALQVATGRVAWTWHPPKPHGVVTVDDLSIGTGSGIGVVLYTYGEGEQYLAGIQVATGRQLWTSAPEPDYEIPVWVSENRFIAGPGPGQPGLDVRDLATGKLDWSSTGRVPAGCEVSDEASAVISGSWVYAMVTCTRGQPDQLYQMSLATGTVAGRAPLQDDACTSASGDPTLWAVPGYVLSGCSYAIGQPAPTGVVPVVITTGTVRQRAVSWSGNPPYANFLASDLNQQTAVTSGDSLYLVQDITKNDQDSYQAAAIDMKTARLLWDKTLAFPGVPAGDAVFPVNPLGADSQGLLDVIEAVGGGNGLSDGTVMTLATLSAGSGQLSYGPGTTYDTYAPESDSGIGQAGLDDQPEYYLDGHVLLSVPQCGIECGDSRQYYGSFIGYSTGSWPSG